jgi:hypothetical protein
MSLTLLAAVLWLIASQRLWSEVPSSFDLPTNEIDNLQTDSQEPLDLRSCLQNPDGPKLTVKFAKSDSASPESLMGQKLDFTTEVKMLEPSADGGFVSRWTITPPIESQVSETPRYSDHLSVAPDKPGLYRIRVALFRHHQLCDFKEFDIKIANPHPEVNPHLFLRNSKLRQWASLQLNKKSRS